jgi:hypothetical protein
MTAVGVRVALGCAYHPGLQNAAVEKGLIQFAND